MLVGICTQISGRRCDRASGRVGKVVRDVVDLQWKRDMRQGVVTCLCEVGLGCGAFPWIGGAQQEKQMVFGLEGLSLSTTASVLAFVSVRNYTLVRWLVQHRVEWLTRPTWERQSL